MLIKKTFQGSLPDNKIINTHSDSQTDTYSCNYLNPNIICINYGRYSYNTSQWENDKVTHSTLGVKIGNKLSTENDSIIIGEEVSIVKISALVSSGGVQRTGDYSMEVHKISNGVDEVIANSYDNGSHYYFPNSIPNKIVNVKQGDIIYVAMGYSFAGSFTIEILSGHLTVEVLK